MKAYVSVEVYLYSFLPSVIYGGDINLFLLSGIEPRFLHRRPQSTMSTALFYLGGPQIALPMPQIESWLSWRDVRTIFTAVTYPMWRFLKRIVSDFGSFSCESMPWSDGYPHSTSATLTAPLQLPASCFKAPDDCFLLQRPLYVQLFAALPRKRGMSQSCDGDAIRRETGTMKIKIIVFIRVNKTVWPDQCHRNELRTCILLCALS
jgi:hypothetical protein